MPWSAGLLELPLALRPTRNSCLFRRRGAVLVPAGREGTAPVDPDCPACGYRTRDEIDRQKYVLKVQRGILMLCRTVLDTLQASR
jgi:hypothetical protein